MTSTKDSIKQYLLKRSVITDSGCWEWNKSLTPNGYGMAHILRKTTRAHRISYSVFVGEIPWGLYVCHKCDNKKCINPEHLFIGTAVDNMEDMKLKNRHKNRIELQKGNKYSAISVLANFIEYESYVAAGIALGVSDNGIRKRIKLKWPGYRRLENKKP